MSSSATLELTKCRPSTEIKKAEKALRSWLLNSFFAVKYINTIDIEPISAAAERQPNSLYPNTFIPRAISHLPSGGWTMNSPAPVLALTSTPFCRSEWALVA